MGPIPRSCPYWKSFPFQRVPVGWSSCMYTQGAPLILIPEDEARFGLARIANRSRVRCGDAFLKAQESMIIRRGVLIPRLLR